MIEIYASLLKNARLRAAKTQQQAADVLNCTTRTIRNYENGENNKTKILYENLLKLCEFYNTDVAQLTVPDADTYLSELDQLVLEYARTEKRNCSSTSYDSYDSEEKSLDELLNLDDSIFKTEDLIGEISKFFQDCTISLEMKLQLARETQKMMLVCLRSKQQEK